MKWPPYLLKMRFQNHRHAFALWLPLFLIWPVVVAFLLAIFLILLPFALLTALFTWESGRLRSVLLGAPAIFRLLGQLPGLVVDVEHSQEHVYIEFF